MSTTVVHCKKEPYDVYIGRPSRWGNPFTIGKDGTREEVIDKYRTWLWGEIESGTIREEDLAFLHGQRLACWCSPQPCHGDILVSAAEWAHHSLTAADWERTL